MGMEDREEIQLQFIPAFNCSYLGYDISAGATNETVGVFFTAVKCLIKRAEMLTTDTVVGDSIFHFDKATQGTEPGSASDGDVAIITVPTGAVAGKAYYDDYPLGITTPIFLEPGQWIVVTLDTQGTSGNVQPAIVAAIIPEFPDNMTRMVETI